MTITSPRAISASLVASQYDLKNRVWSDLGDASKVAKYLCNDRKTVLATAPGTSGTQFRLYASQNADGVTPTWVQLSHVFQARFFSLVKELPNGELMVSNIALNPPASIWISTGWAAALAAGLSPASLAAMTWTNTLTFLSGDAEMAYIGHASAQGDDGTVLISESGPQTTAARATDGVQGATRVWISRNNGQTWALIFDLYEYAKTQGVPNAITVHVHGVSYVEDENRVIINYGDDNGDGKNIAGVSSTGQRYAQVVYIDFDTNNVQTGITKLLQPAEYTNSMQFISCLVLPDRYVFTPDISTPLAAMILMRTGYRTLGKWHLGPEMQLGGVGGRITRLKGARGMPYFLPESGRKSAPENANSMCWSFLVTDDDGATFSVITGDIPAQTPALGAIGFSHILGPTLTGKLLCIGTMSVNNDPTKTTLIGDLVYPEA